MLFHIVRICTYLFVFVQSYLLIRQHRHWYAKWDIENESIFLVSLHGLESTFNSIRPSLKWRILIFSVEVHLSFSNFSWLQYCYGFNLNFWYLHQKCICVQFECEVLIKYKSTEKATLEWFSRMSCKNIFGPFLWNAVLTNNPRSSSSLLVYSAGSAVTNGIWMLWF